MELPAKKETLKVTLEPGVIGVYRTLSNQELAAIWDRSGMQLENGSSQPRPDGTVEVQLRASLSELVRTSEEHLVGFEGADAPTFDGGPFKPGNPGHLKRLKPTWGVTAGSELISDAVMTREIQGNSEAPAAPSPEGSTPSATAGSAGASEG